MTTTTGAAMTIETLQAIACEALPDIEVTNLDGVWVTTILEGEEARQKVSAFLRDIADILRDGGS
jgi:Uma2 family endonuclease